MLDIFGFMWLLAICFAIMGYVRGWARELVATAGIILTTFAFFQFDSLIRTVFFGLETTQLFLIQATAFFVVIVIVYQAKDLGGSGERGDDDFQEGALGALVGALNGYLIGGTLWYFLDINEYPLDQFIIAPGANSAAANNLNWMPLVVFGGGVSGGGDVLSLLVLVILFVVLATI